MTLKERIAIYLMAIQCPGFVWDKVDDYIKYPFLEQADAIIDMMIDHLDDWKSELKAGEPK